MAHKKKRRGRAATGKGRKASKANKLNGNWHCEVCVICLDEPMAKARARGLAGVCQPCGHDAFHLECLAKALAVHAACPVCRDAKAVALPLPPHTRGPAHIAASSRIALVLPSAASSPTATPTRTVNRTRRFVLFNPVLYKCRSE